jgi:HD-GYP domain-containing protein (c-di-GMP phosphodiesterase class II)
MSEVIDRQRNLNAFIALVAVLCAVAMAAAWQLRDPNPGALAVLSACAVAFLLDRSPMIYRVGARGSTAFVVHLASAALFGAFWGGLITGVSTAFNAKARGDGLQRAIFNTTQRILCVVAGYLLYQVVLGGNTPPAFLTAGHVAAAIVQRDLFLFFVFVGTYVLLNKILVAVVVSLKDNRPFREVWHLNSRGIIGYDLGAGVLAAMMAWFYVKADSIGYGPIGLILLILPFIALRHIYAMYQGLQESGQELLQVMVKAIEARDPYTSGHSLRVRELSRAIALELQLSAQQIEDVETAALLHDVGKIHEEFAPLLRKESRLTDEETALMQTHAAKSAELVGIISKFRGSIQHAVRHHHERWDGQGYPEGISGANIPLASRIILIADTIDAMTTDRPYRKRLGLEIVITELQKCRGTQFDPTIVDVAVSSVAVRRLIAGPSGSTEEIPLAPRSLRVSRPSGAFWKTKRA